MGLLICRAISSSLRSREPSAPPLAGEDLAFFDEYPAIEDGQLKKRIHVAGQSSLTGIMECKSDSVGCTLIASIKLSLQIFGNVEPNFWARAIV